MTEEKPGRGKNGRYVRTLDTAQRDAQAVRLRSEGLSYRQIAEQLGYANEGGAHKAVARALQAVPAEAVEELRAVELVRLDLLTRAAFEIATRTHPLVATNGRLVVDGDGKQLLDTAPALHAIDRLLKIAERRARLLGLDAAKKYEVRQQVVTLDAIDAAIADLRHELDALPDASGRMRLPCGAESGSGGAS